MIAGTYKVDLTGTGTGPYHLVVAGLGIPDAGLVDTYEGTAEQGHIDSTSRPSEAMTFSLITS